MVRKRAAYPRDLTNRQRPLIEPLLPPAKPGGRSREVDLREVVNGICYVSRSGCAWRMLPHDLPPWGTVHWSYRQWRLDGTWAKIHEVLRAKVRPAAGREATPSAAIIDSQRVKTTEKGGVCGYDAGTNVKGRKRHIGVDTLGLLLAVVVPSAGIQDRDGARLGLATLLGRFPRVERIWADSNDSGTFVDWVRAFGGWVLDIVRRPANQTGFVLLPRRWVVERTVAWLGRYRRLSKDYEALTTSSETMIRVAMIQLMRRRLAPP